MIKRLIYVLACALLLVGCEDVEKLFKKPSPPPEKKVSYKLSVADIDFTTANKMQIGKAFSAKNVSFLQSINRWEEQWGNDGTYPDADAIRVGYTEQHLLAYFQYDFNKSSAEKTQALLNIIKTNFGEPTNTEGELDSGGEYVANWDMGDGTRIQIKREYPKLTNHLTYYNDRLFETLKLEFAIEARKNVLREAEMSSRLFR